MNFCNPNSCVSNVLQPTSQSNQRKILQIHPHPVVTIQNLVLENTLLTPKASVRCIQNFLRTFEKNLHQKRENSLNILKFGKDSETWFSKICLKVTFPSIKLFILIVRSRFKVRFISLDLDSILHT